MPRSLPVISHHCASLPPWSGLFGPVQTSRRTQSPPSRPVPRTLEPKVRGEGDPSPCHIPLMPPLFHFPPFSWIIRKVVRGLTAPLSARKFRMGSRGLKPCVAACQVGGLHGFPFQNKLLASRGGWPIPKLGESPNARNHHLAMPHLQEPELLHHEEQEDDHRPPRVLKVLQHLPQAHGTQRDEVTSSP
jgi:hypothetical protein